MKLVLSFLVVMVSMITVFAQVSDKKEPASRVKVTDWAEHAMMYGENYWEDKSVEIIAQIGKDEFEKVKAFSSYQTKPCQMTIFCELNADRSPKRIPIDSLRSRLSRLTAYKIAEYTNVHKDGVEVREAILRVAYADNKNWMENVKWDTVYFTFPANLVVKAD